MILFSTIVTVSRNFYFKVMQLYISQLWLLPTRSISHLRLLLLQPYFFQLKITISQQLQIYFIQMQLCILQLQHNLFLIIVTFETLDLTVVTFYCTSRSSVFCNCLCFIATVSLVSHKKYKVYFIYSHNHCLFFTLRQKWAPWRSDEFR